MQYTIKINQIKAMAWGLNSSQAVLFSFVYECPSWADAVEIDGVVHFFLAKTKICEELPLLTDKPDTAWRLLKQLKDKGLIHLTSQGRRTLVALTDLGRTWNRQEHTQPPRKEIRTTEKNPTYHGKKSEVSTEKYPTDQNTTEPSTTSCGGARGTRLPSDWQPPAAFWAEAERIQPSWTPEQVTTCLQNFADYWTARSDKGAVKRDWLATWRLWLRREKLPPATAGNRRTRDMSLREQLTDTSWA